MYALSKFSFVSNFNKDKFSKQEAFNNGLTSVQIQKCDTDGNGDLSIDEILANSEVCDKILAKINSEVNTVVNSIKSLKGEKVQAEAEEKTAEKSDKKPNGFSNLLKQAPKAGQSFTFNIAA